MSYFSIFPGSTWLSSLYITVTIRYATVYQEICFLETLIIWQVFIPYAYAPQFYKGNSEFKDHYKLIPKATLVPNSFRALEQSL